MEQKALVMLTFLWKAGKEFIWYLSAEPKTFVLICILCYLFQLSSHHAHFVKGFIQLAPNSQSLKRFELSYLIFFVPFAIQIPNKDGKLSWSKIFTEWL